MPEKTHVPPKPARGKPLIDKVETKPPLPTPPATDKTILREIKPKRTKNGGEVT